MTSSNSIQVFEFEKLYYDEETSFKKRHWEALCHYLQSVNKHTNKPVPYFQIIHKGIQFTNYVGVIQAGNLTIEILPKIDKLTRVTPQPESKQQWHQALVQMLAECRFLNVTQSNYANLSLLSLSLLDIYLSLLLTEAEKLLHEGLLKKYTQKEGNQKALKGQLLLHKQVQYNSIHTERMYTRSTTYAADNIFNQILYKAVQLVYRISKDEALVDRAGSLLLQFPPVHSIAITAAIFSQLSYNRKTSRYQEAMLLSKMLLLSYRPNITSGTAHTIAIVFDMNRLWEEWVFWRLKKEEDTFGITVQRQQSTAFWEAVHLANPKTIRPDVVIKKGDKTIILDTKWKLLENGTPADDDLKQLFVYNLYWQCEESVLLYPANTEKAPVSGHYKSFPSLGQTVCKCLALSQSVFNDAGKLNPFFGQKVLQKILAK